MTNTLHTRQWSLRRPLAILLVFLLVASACSSDDDSPDESSEASDDPTDQPSDGITLIANQAGEPLTVRLSNGKRIQVASPALLATLEGEALTDEEIEAVLERLPEWTEVDADRTDFNRPPQTLRPPLPGETIDEPFGVGDDLAPADPVSGPLEVLRFQPDGDVAIAPYLSLTFNQPMVPVGTLEQLSTADVPVEMTPDVPGRWQWIGTKTLRFEADSDLVDRLPMATEFTVTVPAGTTSATGGELAAAVDFTFNTPPVSVTEFYPETMSLPLEPIFFVHFDQRIDPDDMLAAIQVEADDDDVELRLATEAEIEADEQVARRVSSATDGRWIAFRGVDAFEPDTQIGIAIGPDAPSAEGPRTPEDVPRYAVSTYAPLKVDDQSCTEDRCEPGSWLWINFNNELDLDAFDPDLISVSPEIRGLSINPQGSSLSLRGLTNGDTTYEVTIDGDLTDVFGQKLGEDTTLDFPIGDARPFIQGFSRELVTLDPLAAEPSIGIGVMNHPELRVQIFDVDPDDFSLFWESARDYAEEGRELPWPVISDEVVATGASDNIFHEHTVELADALDGEPGHVVVLVEPAGRLGDLDREDDDYWRNRPAIVWAQNTRIGLDTFTDDSTLQVWTTDLATGDPLADVEVAFSTGGPVVTTNDDGLATRDTLSGSSWPRIATATKGDDSALMLGDWEGRDPSDSTLWHVFDDRGIYRPGETVSLKGWVRRITTASDAQLTLLGTGSDVNYRVYDAQGADLTEGTTALSAAGGFDFTLDLPGGANLGQAWVELSVSGVNNSGGGHSFQIQEFRTPEFEVSARAETPGPYIVSDPATVAVDAAYYSGGPLPDAPVEWIVNTQAAQYAPPNWDDYTFGTWVPWWSYGGRGIAEDVAIDFFDGDGFPPGGDPGTFEQFSGATDADGSHYLQMDFAGNGDNQPTTVTAQATVTDVNRQAWSSSTNVLVHPADTYVGLRSDATFVRAGDALEISAIVTDIDGNVVVDRPVAFEAARLEWRLENGEWQELPVATETCEATSSQEPISCAFATDIGGRYRVTAIVTDTAGRQNRSELTRWVSGGKPRPNRRVELETAVLIPDAAEYSPGDTAEILVESPFTPSTGLLTVSRNGILSTETFTIDEGSTVLTVPIRDEHTPNVHIQVDLVGATSRVNDAGEPLEGGPDRPAFASGNLNLSVPPVGRTLSVEAVPANPVDEPGADTSVTVTVTDAEGAPVADAELAVVVVDEAVLALTAYELRNPLDSFYGQIQSGVWSDYGRYLIELTNPDLVTANEEMEGAGGDDSDARVDEMADMAAEDGASPAETAPQAARFAESTATTAGEPDIQVRSNFDALALFAPEVVTAADGTATVDLELPDSLTRYRIMVTAVDGVGDFGSGESNLTARLPLQVRPSAPRFLNFGDAFELPVVLQNQTDEDMAVDTVLQTSNLATTGVTGKRVTVPANDRVEVRFAVAADDVGTARFRVAAVSGDHADAATDALPVYTPATSEAFATYGVVDSGAIAQPLLAPTGVFEQFGGLEVNTSSTAVSALTDAVLYLHEYRYESADGYASRLMAIAALRDVLEAFEADGLPEPALLEARVADDIAGLVALQNPDGGFAHWRRWRPSGPYVSIQAMHALIVAEDAGYEVPSEAKSRGMNYLANIEEFIPADYAQSTKDYLSAYALHVRDLDGDGDTGKAQRLYDRAGADLPIDALALLWPVLDNAASEAEVLRRLNNAATETAGAATFATSYGDDAYVILHSDRRTDGVVLGALVTEAADSDLIPKTVAGLLNNQRRGRWDNVQENAFILLSLKRYFDTFEAVTPDFVARLWLGDLYAAEHTYAGRTTDQAQTVIPMTELLGQGDSDLILQKDGEGRLYYRLGLTYAPDDFDLDPLDRGFVTQRSYEGVDDVDDVWRDEDGVWHVKAGAKVRVNLTMVADSRRTHVMLVDPLPAGLEPLNPALAVTGIVPPEPSEDEDGVSPAEDWGYGGSYWWWRWYEHENLRDDRVEAYTSFLSAGTYDYSYVARATTPGTFVVPPLKAEEVYASETFGRSASDTLIVEEVRAG